MATNPLTWITQGSPEELAMRQLYGPQAAGNTMSGNIDPYSVNGGLPDFNLPTDEAFWRSLGYQGPVMNHTAGGSTMAPELLQFVQQGGYRPAVAREGNSGHVGVTDANGLTTQAQQYGMGDHQFWNGALLAGALAGGAAAGWGGAGGAGAEAGGSGAALGGMGTGGGGLTGAVQYGGGLDAALAGGGLTGSTSLGGAASYGGLGGGLSGTATSFNPLQGGSSGGTSLADFFSGNGSAGDYGRLAQTLFGLYSQGRATDAASQGQADANALMARMYDQNRADNQPLLDMRNATLPQIQGLMADPSSVSQMPGYQFQLKQGQDQIDNSLAAQGGYYSGRQLKATTKYGQDYAGSKIDQHLNRLMGVAGLGQIGATANQSNNNTYSLAGSNGLAQQGNIRAGGYMGQGNIVGSGIGGWVNNWQDEQARNGWRGP